MIDIHQILKLLPHRYPILLVDRVLEIEQHLRAASATMDSVLHTYELVHAGPVKTFHDRVLSDVGLL